MDIWEYLGKVEKIENAARRVINPLEVGDNRGGMTIKMPVYQTLHQVTMLYLVQYACCGDYDVLTHAQSMRRIRNSQKNCYECGCVVGANKTPNREGINYSPAKDYGVKQVSWDVPPSILADPPDIVFRGRVRSNVQALSLMPTR